jgi:hypothetical protein
VGGKLNLLPARAQVAIYGTKIKTANDVEFRDYRKFQTDASITFGSDDEKK